jgi:pimeloyl-ACP methyl ester carboxylesterase
MRHGVATLCALAFAMVAVAACARGSKAVVKELKVPGDAVTLHVRIAGHAAAPAVLVALHGGPGNSSDYMVSLEQLAGPRLAVVTYDQRGTGRSSKPSAGYAMASYVADLEAVRQAVGIERLHLLGHSWGGVLALRYAVAHPDRVQSLILMGSGVLKPEAAQQGQAHKAQRIAALQEQGMLPPDMQSLSDILPAYFSDPGFAMPEELKDMYYDPVVEQETWAALEGYDFAAGLDDLHLPVLLVWGEDDPFGTAYLESTQRALTGADLEIVLLENCGHYWHECLEPFFAHVRAFLDTEEHE